MAGSDVAGRSDAEQAEASSTGIRLVHTLMQFRERIADVGETVQLAAKGKGKVFLRQFAELREDVIHARHTDGIQAIGGRGYGSEAHFVETEMVFQVTVNLEHVHGLRSHSHARGDRPGVMASEEFAHFRLDNVVAAAAIGEDAERVIHFLGSVEANGYADFVGGQIIDDDGSEERGVGGKAEIDFDALERGLLAGVVDHFAKHWEIHQGLAAEKSDVHGPATFGLGEQIVHRRLRGLPIHEFFFAFGSGDFVFAEFVAILTRKIALIGEVHHQGLQREMLRELLRSSGNWRSVTNGMDLTEFLNGFGDIQRRVADFLRHTANQVGAGERPIRELVQNRRGSFIERKDTATGDEIEKIAALPAESAEFT